MFRQFCKLGPVSEGELLTSHDKHKNRANISTTSIGFEIKRAKRCKLLESAASE